MTRIDDPYFNITVAISQIKVDIATIKTDVVWMKRLVVTAVTLICATFGADITGVI